MSNLFFILLIALLSFFNIQLSEEPIEEKPVSAGQQEGEKEEEQKTIVEQQQESTTISTQTQEDPQLKPEDATRSTNEEGDETVTLKTAEQAKTTGDIRVATSTAPSQAQQSLVRSILSTVVNFFKRLWSGLTSASTASTSVLLELTKQAETLDALQKTLGSTQNIFPDLPTLRGALSGMREFITSFNQTQKTVQILGQEKPTAAFTFTVRNTDSAHDFLQNQIKAFKVLLTNLVDYPTILEEQKDFVQEQLRRLHSSATQEYALRTAAGSANLYESYQNGLVSDSLRTHLEGAISKGSFPESTTATLAERAYEVFGLPNFATVDEVQAKWVEMGKRYSANLSDPLYLAAREAVSIIGDPLGKSLYDSFLLAKNNTGLQEQFNQLALSSNSLARLSEQVVAPLQIAATIGNVTEKSPEELEDLKALIKQF